MIWCKDISKVIKKTQETVYIDDIDIYEIRSILSDIKWENCKVIVSGNDLVESKTSSEDWEHEGIT